MSTLVVGADMGNWLLPYPCVATKNRESYLSCGGTPSSKESQTHTRLPNLEDNCCEEESP